MASQGAGSLAANVPLQYCYCHSASVTLPHLILPGDFMWFDGCTARVVVVVVVVEVVVVVVDGGGFRGTNK